MALESGQQSHRTELQKQAKLSQAKQRQEKQRSGERMRSDEMAPLLIAAANHLACLAIDIARGGHTDSVIRLVRDLYKNSDLV
ncbi:hypothetical protein AXG93_1913s1730 [Marchantia polymorpha subsp. ruderalis]|uniref:Uncharacterized protein n=1 Tax=Marchantia polymorpha subsp. ruderalis TaxID=1480154 RepID=A0A176WKE5_MARPO|nr:hypothetical protein AXG93_1913s1730 [Marchantia polymorpha subsp. ruderalis]